MFAHCSYMPQAHQVALATAIRNHNFGTGISPTLLATLYKLALDGLNSPVAQEGMMTSTLRDAQTTLSSATDSKTGIFIQLSHVPNQQPFLTAGQKWTVEGMNRTLGNTATMFW